MAASPSATAQLLGGKLFNVSMPASWNMNPTGDRRFVQWAKTGQARPGPPGRSGAGEARQPVQAGRHTAPPRIDIPAIVTGSEVYIQNIRLPGMLHGRVVRPRGQSVYGFGAPIVSIDESSIKHLPDVQIVRKSDFLGVVAPHEYDAIQAAAQLKVKWADPPAVLPGGGNEFAADAGTRRVPARRLRSATPTGDDDAMADAVMLTPRWPRRRTLSAASTASRRSSTPRLARCRGR